MDELTNRNISIFPLIKLAQILDENHKEIDFYSCYGICVIDYKDENFLILQNLTEKYNGKIIIKVNGNLSKKSIILLKELKIKIILNEDNENLNDFQTNFVILSLQLPIINLEYFISKGYTYFLLNMKKNQEKIIEMPIKFPKNINTIFLFEDLNIGYIFSKILNMNEMNICFPSLKISIGNFYEELLRNSSHNNHYIIIILNNEGVLINFLQVSYPQHFIDIINKKNIEIFGNSFIINKIVLSPLNNCLLIYIDNPIEQNLSFVKDDDPFYGDLKNLHLLLKNRQKSNDKKSYTVKMLADSNKIKTKLNEEATELISTETKDEIIHEASDLFYFITLNLLFHKLSLFDVESRLFKNILTKSFKPCQQIVASKVFRIAILEINQGFNKLISSDIIIISKKGESIIVKSNDNRKKILEISTQDISTFIRNGLVDSILCFEHFIDNLSLDLHSLSVNCNKCSNLVIFSKKITNLTEIFAINKGKKIIVMTEFVKLANNWIRKLNIKAKVVYISQNCESYLQEDFCDLILVQYNEETHKIFNFYLLDKYSDYQIKFFVPEENLIKFKTTFNKIDI